MLIFDSLDLTINRRSIGDSGSHIMAVGLVAVNIYRQSLGIFGRIRSTVLVRAVRL